MKHINVYALLLVSGFLSSCGQNQTDITQNNTRSETKKSTSSGQYKDSLAQDSLLKAEISNGSIYESTSPYHNVLHEFTHLVAMRDFCNKSLLQMRANRQVDNKLSKELKKELSNANAALTLSKFNGLKIESGLYEKFLKQINDRFKD